MMMSGRTPEGLLDLDILGRYLDSERAPPDCMDLSRLDGFLTAIVIGPEMIAPSEFLPVVWGGGQPHFADVEEGDQVLGGILGRYNEIAAELTTEPPSYAPIFWEDAAGNCVTEDWAVGFMQAVALRSDAWEVAMMDEDVAPLLIPIGIIAGVAHPEVALDEALPDGFLDELMSKAPSLLPGCVVELRAFWTERAAGGNDGRDDQTIN